MTFPVERGQHEGLESVGERVGRRVVGVVDRRPPELDVSVEEAARAAANRLLDFSKLEGKNEHLRFSSHVIKLIIRWRIRKNTLQMSDLDVHNFNDKT